MIALGFDELNCIKEASTSRFSPRFSRNSSNGPFKSTTQLSKNALKRDIDGTLNACFPVLFKMKMNKKLERSPMTGDKMKNKNMKKLKGYPVPIQNSKNGTMQMKGLIRDAAKRRLCSVGDVENSTIERNMMIAENPKRHSLIAHDEPNDEAIATPMEIKKSQKPQLKRESPVIRLKS
jgi:hypothetical protein